MREKKMIEHPDFTPKRMPPPPPTTASVSMTREQILEIKRTADRKRLEALEEKRKYRKDLEELHVELERIARSFAKTLIGENHSSIMRSWITHQIGPPGDDIGCVDTFLWIFGYKKFCVNASPHFIEMWEDLPTLRIERTQFSQNTKDKFRKIIEYEESVWIEEEVPFTMFFKKSTCVNLSENIYSEFQFNEVFEEIVDRRTLLVSFLWHTYQFHRFDPAELSVDDRDFLFLLGRYLALVMERFLTKHWELWETPYYQFLEKIATMVEDPFVLKQHLKEFL